MKDTTSEDYEDRRRAAVAGAYEAGRDDADEIARTLIEYFHDLGWDDDDIADLFADLETEDSEGWDDLPPRPSIWDSDWIALAAGLDDPSVTDPEPSEPILTPEDEAACFRAYKQGFEDIYEDACVTTMREWLTMLDERAGSAYYIRPELP